MSIKRVFSLLMLSAMIVTLPLFAQSAGAQNVLVYNGFEVSYEGWTEWGDYNTLEARADAAYNSSRGMRVINRRTAAEGAASDKGFYIEAGDNIGFSVFARHGGTRSETFNLTLQWRYPESDRTGSAVIATAAAQPNQWVELSGRYTVSAGTANPIFIITTNSTVNFDFDEFKITGGQTRLQKAMAQADVQPNPPPNPGLKDVYARHFRVGNILNGNTVNNQAIRNLILREYNSITAENEHKPDQTKNRSQSTNTNIVASFGTGAAAINAFLETNNIPLRDHALTWHGQTPDWFFIQNINDNTNHRSRAVADVPWATQDVMNQRLESYIRSKFRLYADRYPNLIVYAVDVVNEYVMMYGSNGGPRRPGFDNAGAGMGGNSAWTAIYHGTNNDPSPMSWTATSVQNTNNWLWRAFHYARQYAPAHTKLFYNDYNEFDPNKRRYIIEQILNPLHERGLIDGMGMQGHIDADQGGWSSWERFRDAMDAYARVGNAQRGFLEVQITELDVSRGMSNGTLRFTEAQQATKYRQIFEHAIAVNARGQGQFSAICIWTINDAHSWIGENQPALHDRNNNPKPAYTAVFNVVPASQHDNGNNPPCCPIVGGGTPSHMVTVVGGTGGGSRAVGSSVTITATVPAGMQFVNWTTTTQGVTFASATSATTTFTMPDRAVTVTANFRCPTVNPDANGYFFHHTFETAAQGTQGWGGRIGPETAANVTTQAANGSRSVFVSGRTESWHGVAYPLDACTFVPGNTYSFSGIAMYAEGPATSSFKLTLQYDLNSDVVWAGVDSTVANRGAWVMLENANFPIPAGATNLILYVEMPGNLTSSFYIDDMMGGRAGAEAPGREGVTSVANIRNNVRLMPLVTFKSNSLTINAQPHERVQVRVVNMTGKTVASFNVKGGANLSLRKVPAGVYVVEANKVGGGSTAVVRQRVTLKK